MTFWHKHQEERVAASLAEAEHNKRLLHRKLDELDKEIRRMNEVLSENGITLFILKAAGAKHGR